MIQRLLLLVGLWFLPFTYLTAQVGFSMPVINNAVPGSIVTFPVRVSNFDSIVGVQFVIQWDTQVLDLLTTLSLNLPGLMSDDFGWVDVPSGKLRFAWEAPSSATGYSTPDETPIFYLKFRVVGENNQGTSVIFTEDVPTVYFEVAQVTSVPDSTALLGLNECNISNGFVAVGYTLSTDWLDEPNNLPTAISPNPFSNSTTATFTLDTGTDVHMILTDAAGHPIFEKKTAYSAGQHGMEIVSDQLKENGIYYLILRTATRSCIRPLIKF